MSKSRFQGISLDSFLQMIQMDKTSCTLRVESHGGYVGVLYLVNGELVDAECGESSGPEAAFEIVSWRDISFEFDNICDDRIRKINMPLMHLLMEGLKRRDDRAAGLIPEPQKPQTPPPSVKKPEPVTKPEIPVLDIPAVTIPSPSLPKQDESQIFQKPVLNDPFSFKTIEKKSASPGLKISKQLIIRAGIAIALIVVIVSVILLFTGKSGEQKLLQVFDQVAKTPEYPDKIIIIQKYIDENRNSEYFQKASDKLSEIKKEKADKEFKKLDQQIKSLAINDGFLVEAKRILDAYLRANPDSPHNDEVSDRINKLSDVYESAMFEKAQATGSDDIEKRAASLSVYLTKFPGGKNNEKAKTLLLDVEQAFFKLLVSMSGQCVEKNDFSPCVIKTESYRKIFGKDSRKYDIENLLANMAGGRDLIELRQKADALGDDLDAKLNLYYDYLRKNTDNTESRRQVRIEADEFERLIADKKDWESSRSYATNALYPIKERARRLESFIARKPKSIYVAEAKNLLASMGAVRPFSEPSPAISSEPQVSKKSQAADQVSGIGSSSTSADFARGWANIEQASGTRFINNRNGTFTDSMTGKIWCILDSKADAGRCLNYRDALAYVSSLNTGGYGWRMPTAAELFAVYKNAPALPDTGSKWYWTSDASWRGQNEIVRIVRPGIENEIRNESTAISDCGYVRAVRN